MPCPPVLSMSAQRDAYFNHSTINIVQGDQLNVNHGTTEDNWRQSIFRWLAAPDPSSNHKAACKKRQPDTGKWFIKGNVFAEWKTSSSHLLWLYGCPGCGKTVLSSNIIQDIMKHCEANPSFAMAYFYFDFQDREKQHCQNLVRSLITQFLRQCTSIPEGIQRLYSDFQHAGSQPDLDDLATALKDILQEFQHVFIILDALDECKEREVLLRFVEDVVDWKMSTVRILVTSRQEREIEDCLAPRVSRRVDIQASVVAGDIGIHVREQLQKDQKLRKWSTKVKVEIEAALTKGAHGMFRWVACQLDELRKCAKLSELRNALNSLPRTLDDTYERILINIDELYRDDVQKVLQWLCFSLRPVQLTEIVEALAVTFDDGPMFDPDERYADPRDILTRCSSLVSLSSKTEDEGVLRLAHFSVKEYLISNRIQNNRACMYAVIQYRADELIAQTCLAYLMQFKTAKGLNSSTIKNYPLAEYAAQYWVEHVRYARETSSDAFHALIMELFQTSESQHYSPQFLSWVRIFDIDQPWRGTELDRHSNDIPSPLYYAALENMPPEVLAILQMQGNANAREGLYGSALQAASFRGHEGIVKLLLDHPGEVNAQLEHYRNALQVATAGGYEEIVKLLLEHGVDANSHGEDHASALQEASFRGHEGIIKLLLDHNVDVNAEGGDHNSALLSASVGGHEGIVKLLLERNVDVNAVGRRGRSALQVASFQGHKRIVELLLENNADVNIQGVYGSALQSASIAGHKAIVELLLEQNVGLNAQEQYGSALQSASFGGHKTIVKLLLEHGADVNAIGGRYGTAVQAASFKGHEGIVKLLLERGADVNAWGRHGSALQSASIGGHKSVVKLLLENGADIDAEGGKYGNALQAAASNGREEIFKLLQAAPSCSHKEGTTVHFLTRSRIGCHVIRER